MDRKNILLLGDSISLGYMKYLKEGINDRYNLQVIGNIHKALDNLENVKESNCGDSNNVINIIEEQINLKKHYDILLINCGLHDVRIDRETQLIQVPMEIYESNLKKILELSKKISHKLIWITTTPIDDNIHNKRKLGYIRHNSDILNYNKVALEVYKDIETIDLYNFTLLIEEDKYKDHVHFKNKVCKLQADYIGTVLNNLKFGY